VEGALQKLVGNNIRRLRQQRGLSQEDFGPTVGWHRTFVGAVERGERNLTLRTVERVSEDLGVDPLVLLWDEAYGEMPDFSDEPSSDAPSPDARAAAGGEDPGDGSPAARRPRPSA